MSTTTNFTQQLTMTTLYELSDQFQSICNILESLEDEQIPVELQREVESLLAQKDETQTQLYKTS